MSAPETMTAAVRDDQQDRHERLSRTWCKPPGFWGWFMDVHHTSIGIRYMVTSFIFFLLGGVLAAMMRMQLSAPEYNLLGPDKYNQFFTVHGSTMIFLFAVPMMFQGFGVYLVPLMCGARNIAFPRLNAFSYYIYLGGGLLLWIGLFLNTGADVGWFAYVPLSGPQYSPGKRADFWAQMITFTEVSALGVAICIATTILRYRVPGMTLNRMPILLWEKLVLSLMVIFAMPAVMVVSSMLLLDRLIGTQFFNVAEGGDRPALPALVLVLWPSGGLHHFPSRCGNRVHARGRLYPPPGVRVYPHRLVRRIHRLSGIRRVGASHVRHWFAANERKFFHRRHLDDRDSYRHAIFLLDRDHMARQATTRIPDVVGVWLFLRFRDRRPVGSHAGQRTRGYPGARYLLHSGPFSLRHDWWRGLSDVRRPLPLDPQDDWPHAQ